MDTTAQFCEPGALELKCEIRRRLQRAQRNRASVLCEQWLAAALGPSGEINLFFLACHYRWCCEI